MQICIVTGMSGAGKSAALNALEDIGYHCIDNLPADLIPELIEHWSEKKDGEYCPEKAAFGVDIRSGKLDHEINCMESVTNLLSSRGHQIELLFMDCQDDILVRRYKTTRRAHPLQFESVPEKQHRPRLEDAIQYERELLKPLHEKATLVVDTSNTNIWQNRDRIQSFFSHSLVKGKMKVMVVSFGFSKGIPADCDLILDVRFLPNPHYVETLRPHTGKDQDVVDYVMQNGQGQILLDKYSDLLSFLIPNYQKEGKQQLVIGVGCTGGKHRSVTIARLLTKTLQEKNFEAICMHRDIE